MEKEEKKDKTIETPALDAVRVLKSAIYCQVGPVEMLRYVKDDDGVIHYVSDVNLLMNAERLRNQIGEESYLNLIRGIQPKNLRMIINIQTNNCLQRLSPGLYKLLPKSLLGLNPLDQQEILSALSLMHSWNQYNSISSLRRLVILKKLLNNAN